MTRILIAGGGTGGHLMPALAVADAIAQREPDWQVVLVGAARGVEATLLPHRPYRFHLLPAEPIYRRQWWKNLHWPLLLPRLRRATAKLLDEERPDLVLGTGGYAAGPVVWMAARRGIPTAIFEADAMPGFTTRVLAPRVRQIFLATPEALARLRPGPVTQVQVTGAPVQAPAPAAAAAGRATYAPEAGRPVLLAFGGSQGSLALNQAMAGWLGLPEAGAPRPQIIWATGRATYDRFRAFHRPPDVHVVPFLDPIAPAYAVADLAIARAGMMTIAELCAWGLPSILIPLPTAAADHQTFNAAAMASAGAALHLPQPELTPDRLCRETQGLLQSPERLSRLRMAAQARGKPHATAEILASLKALSQAR